ncbi:hypothetical protein [Paenibacillus sp. UNC451MF]|uniref:hypothetical protein n=1 Tax=Paenibacillus sp. UNC451MF TaxID=1449063 RepID=UPI00048E8B3A|nr:hypothetical protein [Paenibacillus sp. UNC451MF]
MSRHEEDIQLKLKLHILKSLARSQRALAVIMESMAEVVEGSHYVAKGLVEQIESISNYQRQIAVKMIGLKIRRKKRGKPVKPWLNRKLRRFPPTISNSR